MSDVVSFAEIDGQHLELLPTRTLLQTGSTTDLLSSLPEPLGSLFSGSSSSGTEGSGSGGGLSLVSDLTSGQ